MSDVTDLESEAAALSESLKADGVPMCTSCGMRPARARKTLTGKAPTTCSVCAQKKGRGGPKPPPSVKIAFGQPRKGKADNDVALVEAKAKQTALMIAVGLKLVGQDADAEVVTVGAAPWAQAVSGLAPYEPWLVKLCQGGEASGRALAWVTVGMATLGLLGPVLINHDLIPQGPLQALLGSVAAQAAVAVDEPASPAA